MRNNKLGFTLIEVMIAMTILAIVSLGIATSFVQMNNTQSKISAKSEANSLESKLTKFLNSNDFCEHNLLGKNFRDSQFSRGLVIQDRNRVISKKGRSFQKGHVFEASGSGQDILHKLEISFSPTTRAIFHQGQRGLSRLAKVNFSILSKKQGKDIQNVEKTIPFFIITNDSGVISSCDLRKSERTKCEATGGQYNPITNECVATEKGCFARGTYIKWSCTGTREGDEEVCGNGLVEYLEQKGEVTEEEAAEINKRIELNGVPNPYTGDLSCPKDYNPVQTNVDDYTYNLSAGKKKSYTIREVSRFFTCMKCK